MRRFQQWLAGFSGPSPSPAQFHFPTAADWQRELIDASASPVIFSHSNPRAMWDSPRNIPDELIEAAIREQMPLPDEFFGEQWHLREFSGEGDS